MKVTEARGGRNERLILTGVITSRPVLAAVSAVWDGKLFSARWSNIIAGWCVAHYRKLRKPPGRDVQSLFDRWADSNQADADTVGLVSAFLADLSRGFAARKKEIDPDYVIDLAKEYFDRTRLATLKEEINGLIGTGEVAEAKRRVSAFRPVELGTGALTNPLTDLAAVDEALREKTEKPLIEFPEGALRTFFGGSMEREGFITIQAPEKRGKTTVLLDLAWRAMEQGRRVALFQLGDLSRNQFLRRFYARACGRPVGATPPDKHVLVPTYLGPPTATGGLPDVRHDQMRWDKPLTRERVEKKLKGLRKRYGKEPFKLSVHPARTLTVAGATEILDRWEREGWRPDVVVFDYAELFAAADGRADTRDQTNATWLGMASLRLQKKCLVITATQTNAASYETEIITMGNFSEDKRKHSHVTGAFALNQTDEEKQLGLYRFNWLVGRDWDYSTTKCVYAAGCAATQNPMMYATF
jgi:hypothetical protein